MSRPQPRIHERPRDDPTVPMGRLFGDGSDPLRHQLLSDAAAARITELIESGQFRPGQKLPPERELAKSLDVSRLVVREAFQVLQAMGLVRAHVGRGRFVSDGSPDGRSSFFMSHWLQLHREELEDLTEVRALLESAAADTVPFEKLAEVGRRSRAVQSRAERRLEAGDLVGLAELDREFHGLSVEYSANRPLRVLARGIIDVMRPSVRAVMAVRESAELSLRQHERIVKAFEARDREVASAAIAHHLRSANKYALSVTFASEDLVQHSLPTPPPFERT